jgi:hypothetical protein
MTSILFLFLFYTSASKFKTRNPQLATFTVAVPAHPSVWREPLRQPSVRHTRHYSLWSRVCRQLTRSNSPLSFGHDWNQADHVAHLKHRWLSDPRLSIGPDFNSFPILGPSVGLLTHLITFIAAINY